MKISEANNIVTSSNKTPQTPKMYLKIDSLSGKTFKRIMDLLSIFPGNTAIIFYDTSSKKYIKASGIGASQVPSMIKLLKNILGDENVVIK